MAQSLNGIFALLIFVTVALTALSVGLVTSVDMIKAALRRWRVVVILLLNCLAVPVIAYFVSSALPLTTGAKTGVLLCAICAGGPLGLKATQIAKGDLTWSLSLTVMLLILNVVTLPLWTAALVDVPVGLRIGDLMGVLGAAILVPVAVGMALQSAVDAQRWFKLMTLASNGLLIAAVGVGVTANAEGLVGSLSSSLLVAVLTVVSIAGVAAWFIRDQPGRRQASTFATFNRATSVALLIIGRSFADQSEVFTAAVVFGVVQTVIAVGLAIYWGAARSRSAAPAVVTS